MTFTAWLIFLVAALMEVGGDALVRTGLRGRGILFIAAGFATLGTYGLVVNMVRWDFSKLLGVYVAFFSLVSVLFGLLIFKENVPISTWLGLLLIMAGGLTIQFGSH